MNLPTFYGLQSETGTPARNALSEHYPTTGLKIPLTVFVLDRSRRCFDDPAHPPHPPKSMLSREGAAGSQRHSS